MEDEGDLMAHATACSLERQDARSRSLKATLAGRVLAMCPAGLTCRDLIAQAFYAPGRQCCLATAADLPTTSEWADRPPLLTGRSRKHARRYTVARICVPNRMDALVAIVFGPVALAQGGSAGDGGWLTRRALCSVWDQASLKRAGQEPTRRASRGGDFQLFNQFSDVKAPRRPAA